MSLIERYKAADAALDEAETAYETAKDDLDEMIYGDLLLDVGVVVIDGAESVLDAARAVILARHTVARLEAEGGEALTALIADVIGAGDDEEDVPDDVAGGFDDGPDDDGLDGRE